MGTTRNDKSSVPSCGSYLAIDTYGSKCNLCSSECSSSFRRYAHRLYLAHDPWNSRLLIAKHWKESTEASGFDYQFLILMILFLS